MLKDLFDNKQKQLNLLKETVQEKYDFDFNVLKDFSNLPQLIEHHQTCKDNIVKNSTFNSYHTDKHYNKHCMILDMLKLYESLSEADVVPFKQPEHDTDQVKSSNNAYAIGSALLDIGKILPSGYAQTNFYKMAEKAFGADVSKELYWMFNPYEDDEYPSTEQTEKAEAANNIEKGLRDKKPATLFIIKNMNRIEDLAKKVAAGDNTKLVEEGPTDYNEQDKLSSLSVSVLNRMRSNLKRSIYKNILNKPTEEQAKKLIAITLAINVASARERRNKKDFVKESHYFSGFKVLVKKEGKKDSTINVKGANTKEDAISAAKNLMKKYHGGEYENYSYEAIDNSKPANEANYFVDREDGPKGEDRSLPFEFNWAFENDLMLKQKVIDIVKKAIADKVYYFDGLDELLPSVVYNDKEKREATYGLFSSMWDDEGTHIHADEAIEETAPKGWEGTVKAMKKDKEITNPWALAHYMKNKGYKSHIKEDPDIIKKKKEIKKSDPNWQSKDYDLGADLEDDEFDQLADYDAGADYEEDLDEADYFVHPNDSKEDHKAELDKRAVNLCKAFLKKGYSKEQVLNNLKSSKSFKTWGKKALVALSKAQKEVDQENKIKQIDALKSFESKTNEGTSKMTNDITKSIKESMELDKAEIVLAVQAMSDVLQSTIEKMSKMQVEDLLPIVERIKAEYGVDFAMSVEQSVNDALTMSVESLKQSKDSVDNEALKLSGELPMNSMATEPEMPVEEPDTEEMPVEEPSGEFGGAEAATGPEEEPLGRAKKESIGENASGGSTCAGGIAQIPMPIGKKKQVIKRRVENVKEAVLPIINKIVNQLEPMVEKAVADGRFERHYDAIVHLLNKNKDKISKQANIDVVQRVLVQRINHKLETGLLKEIDKGDSATYKGDKVKVEVPNGPGDLVGVTTNHKVKMVPAKDLKEKWGTEVKVKPSEEGKWSDYTVAELRKKRSALKAKEDRTKEETDRLREINFAIRAKTGWGKVESVQESEYNFNKKEEKETDEVEEASDEVETEEVASKEPKANPFVKKADAKAPTDPKVSAAPKTSGSKDNYLLGEPAKGKPVEIKQAEVNSMLDIVAVPTAGGEKPTLESQIATLEGLIGNGTIVDPKDPRAKQLARLYMKQDEACKMSKKKDKVVEDVAVDNATEQRKKNIDKLISQGFVFATMDKSVVGARPYYSKTEEEAKELEKLMYKPETMELKDLY